MKTKFTVKPTETQGLFISEDIDLSVVYGSRCFYCGKPIDHHAAVEVFSDGYFVSADENLVDEHGEGPSMAVHIGRDCAKSLFGWSK